MRKVIPLQEHEEMAFDCGLHVRLRDDVSGTVKDADGKDVCLHYYEAPGRGVFLTYDTTRALSGYFPTIAEAQSAYGQHAHLLRENGAFK